MDYSHKRKSDRPLPGCAIAFSNHQINIAIIMTQTTEHATVPNTVKTVNVKAEAQKIANQLADLNQLIGRREALSDLTHLTTAVEAIAGKLKTLWRSQELQNEGRSPFDSMIGQGSDSALIETIIDDLHDVHLQIRNATAIASSRETLKERLYELIVTHDLQEVLDRIAEIVDNQANISQLPVDTEHLLTVNQHLEAAIASAGELSDGFYIG